MRTLFQQPMADYRNRVLRFACVVDAIVRGERNAMLTVASDTARSTFPVSDLLLELVVEQEIRIHLEVLPGEPPQFRPLQIDVAEHAMPRERFVVYSENEGIYLGECLGLGFWTKIDPVGQDAAWAFPTRDAADAFIAEHLSGDARLFDARPVVVGVNGDFASIADCVAAGLPGWDPNDPGCANAGITGQSLT